MLAYRLLPSKDTGPSEYVDAGELVDDGQGYPPSRPLVVRKSNRAMIPTLAGIYVLRQTSVIKGSVICNNSKGFHDVQFYCEYFSPFWFICNSPTDDMSSLWGRRRIRGTRYGGLHLHGDKPKMDHIGHCIDSIRESLVCNADLTPNVWQWREEAGVACWF